MLQNILERTGQSLTTKNYLTENVSCTKVKKPWFVSFLCSVLSVDNTGVLKKLHLRPFLRAIAPPVGMGNAQK